jgi:hypothetical protein
MIIQATSDSGNLAGCSYVSWDDVRTASPDIACSGVYPQIEVACDTTPPLWKISRSLLCFDTSQASSIETATLYMKLYKKRPDVGTLRVTRLTEDYRPLGLEDWNSGQTEAEVNIQLAGLSEGQWFSASVNPSGVSLSGVTCYLIAQYEYDTLNIDPNEGSNVSYGGSWYGPNSDDGPYLEIVENA